MAKVTNIEEKAASTEEKAPEGNAGQEVEKEKTFWIVKVKNNPDFCGIGAGGIQFANGQAKITSPRMAEWFKEHDGYEVK